MAVNLEKTYGAAPTRGVVSRRIAGQRDSGREVETREPAQFWLNIGYAKKATLENGTVEERFVSLPLGIPLDSMEELPTNSRNEQYALFNMARNALLAGVEAQAAKLQPGEDVILNLQVQLRRVNAEAPETKANNPFAMTFELVAAA